MPLKSTLEQLEVTGSMAYAAASDESIGIFGKRFTASTEDDTPIDVVLATLEGAGDCFISIIAKAKKLGPVFPGDGIDRYGVFRLGGYLKRAGSVSFVADIGGAANPFPLGNPIVESELDGIAAELGIDGDDVIATLTGLAATTLTWTIEMQASKAA